MIGASHLLFFANFQELPTKPMSPLAIFINIAIVVGIVGIVVYWVRRFAVFRGYKSIEADALRIAEMLKTQPVRDGKDVVIAGHYGGHPTIVQLSNRLDKPGLHIKMRVPATFSLSIMPKSAALAGQGRVLMRTGNAILDRRFNARSDQPLEVRMFLGTAAALGTMEKICCSTQTGFAIKNRVMELTELTIPRFTGNHIASHLEAMAALAQRLEDMPGASEIKIQPLPPQGSSITIRVALALGLVALVGLLFIQPYNRPSANASMKSNVRPSGVDAIDASRISKLAGWHVAGPDELSGRAVTFLREHNLAITGHARGNFSGQPGVPDSAYLLLNDQGEQRVCMLSQGQVIYDAIFPRVDMLVRIPRNELGKIQWITAPQGPSEGDGLLVVQNADDPTAGLVLLKHGPRTYSARPADFTDIDLISR
jgi:hypothetical protein